ncbi:MAG: glutaredoxin 3 [Acidobacteriota bacterium]
MSAQVEIYSAPGCPYCRRAKRLLREKGVPFVEHRLCIALLWLLPTGTFREMKERSGGRDTVPQIFINGRHVGGCDDLIALERAGQLDRLLGT